MSEEARKVADRLQELSVTDAERVLERAISLQLDDDLPDTNRMMDREILMRIAKELDIDPAHLEQALVEELFRVEVEEPSLIDRLVVPSRMVESGVSPLGAEDAKKVIDVWMQRHEGLRKTAEHGAVTTWEKNKSLVASARQALRMADGSGQLRNATNVVTSVRAATEDQSVVVAEADMSNIRVLALGLLGGAVAVGGTTAIGAAASGESVGTAAAIGVGIGALTGGGILLGFKMWANQIRNGLRSAIGAMTSPHLVRDTSMTGMVGEVVSEIKELGNDLRSGRDRWGRPNGDR